MEEFFETLDVEQATSEKPDYKKQYGKKQWKKSDYKRINLWNKDEVVPLEVNPDKAETGNYLTIVMPSPDYELNDEDKKHFYNVMFLAEKAGYKVRYVCSYASQLAKLIDKMFGKDKVEIYAPWKKFCNLKDKDTKLIYPSDYNIRAAAWHVKNFDKLPTSVKYIKSAIIGSMIGRNNRLFSMYILTHDRNMKPKKKIDYKKSKNNVDYFFLSKTFGMNFINLANDDEYLDLVKLLNNAGS